MAESKVLIAVAVIGVVGTIGAAVIANVDKLFPKTPSPAVPSQTPQPRLGTPDQGVTKRSPPVQPESDRTRFTGRMGPLEEGISYNQGDMYDRPANSPQECAAACYNDDRCIAVTYVTDQKRCWLKNSIGPIGRSPAMVSSRKLAR